MRALLAPPDVHLVRKGQLQFKVSWRFRQLWLIYRLETQIRLPGLSESVVALSIPA
jgi:hypothetical protein